MSDKINVIKCPHCGYEYLPAEIFYPNRFFGNPTNIIRDNDGKILNFDGDSLDIYETYTCDKCNEPFKVATRVMFLATPDKTNFFDEEYSTPINKEPLVLFETGQEDK